jgi:hypothetical protein
VSASAGVIPFDSDPNSLSSRDLPNIAYSSTAFLIPQSTSDNRCRHHSSAGEQRDWKHVDVGGQAGVSLTLVPGNPWVGNAGPLVTTSIQAHTTFDACFRLLAMLANRMSRHGLSAVAARRTRAVASHMMSSSATIPGSMSSDPSAVSFPSPEVGEVARADEEGRSLYASSRMASSENTFSTDRRNTMLLTVP